MARSTPRRSAHCNMPGWRGMRFAIFLTAKPSGRSYGRRSMWSGEKSRENPFGATPRNTIGELAHQVNSIREENGKYEEAVGCGSRTRGHDGQHCRHGTNYGTGLRQCVSYRAFEE